MLTTKDATNELYTCKTSAWLQQLRVTPLVVGQQSPSSAAHALCALQLAPELGGVGDGAGLDPQQASMTPLLAGQQSPSRPAHPLCALQLAPALGVGVGLLGGHALNEVEEAWMVQPHDARPNPCGELEPNVTWGLVVMLVISMQLLGSDEQPAL